MGFKERGISGARHPPGHQLIAHCCGTTLIAQPRGHNREEKYKQNNNKTKEETKSENKNKATRRKAEFIVINITDVSLALSSYLLVFSFPVLSLFWPYSYIDTRAL